MLVRRVGPVGRPLPARHGARRGSGARVFTGDSSLDATVLRMIAMNSLAAFTQDVTRTAGIGGGPRDVSPVRPANPVEPARAASPAAPQDRTLGTLPATPPSGPLPRGSLLDLRV